jgi:RimJ/RimL family protein N-acetyltransferase
MICNLELLSLRYLDDLYEITSDYSIMKNIGNLKVWSYEKTKRFIEYGNSDDYTYYGIIVSNKLVGVIGVYTSSGIDHYYLTIFIHKKYLHKGLGSKALQLFLKKYNKQVNIYADVLLSNIESFNFFKKNYRYVTMDSVYRFYIRLVD